MPNLYSSDHVPSLSRSTPLPHSLSTEPSPSHPSRLAWSLAYSPSPPRSPLCPSPSHSTPQPSPSDNPLSLQPAPTRCPSSWTPWMRSRKRGACVRVLDDVCVRVSVRVCVCVRACVHACVRACECVSERLNVCFLIRAYEMCVCLCEGMPAHMTAATCGPQGCDSVGVKAFLHACVFFCNSLSFSPSPVPPLSPTPVVARCLWSMSCWTASMTARLPRTTSADCCRGRTWWVLPCSLLLDSRLKAQEVARLQAAPLLCCSFTSIAGSRIRGSAGCLSLERRASMRQDELLLCACLLQLGVHHLLHT